MLLSVCRRWLGTSGAVRSRPAAVTKACTARRLLVVPSRGLLCVGRRSGANSELGSAPVRMLASGVNEHVHGVVFDMDGTLTMPTQIDFGEWSHCDNVCWINFVAQ